MLALSIFINGRGAVAAETMRWNSKPINVDQAKWRIWDWRNPQFLAGLLRPPLPSVFPSLKPSERVDLGAAGSKLFSRTVGVERGVFRWTEVPNGIVFALRSTRN